MLPALIRMKTKFFYNKSHNKSMEKKSKIIRVMKLTCILFFMSVSMLFAAGSYAQSASLTMKVTDKSITDVLEAIENQTEFKFFYNSKLVNTNRKVSIDVKNENVFTVLEQLFKNSKTSYKVVDKDVILTVADVAMAKVSDVVTGTVVDQSGYPVIGANVVEKGTTNGTVTDASGKFTLNIGANATLVVSYIGYISMEVQVKGKTSLSITLKEDQELLEEVVVVGYGVTKKRDLAGAITSLKTEDIKAGVVTNTAQFLKGRAAGVQVRQDSSEPGGGISIRIRGASSISSNNEPLYVIDGFQTEIGNQINPEDIASIEILKDAAATAIYGARGANGVVIITTKKGSKNHFEVNYSYNASVKKLRNPWDLMDAQATIKNNMKVWEENGSTGNPPYTAEQLNYKGTGVDWIDETTRTAMTQTHQFSLAGGGEKLSMAISGNYTDDLGVLVNTNFNRFSSRVNLEYKLTDRVRFGSNLYMARSKKNYLNMGTNSTTDNVIYNIFMMSPLTTPSGEDVFGVKGKKPGILNELYDIDFDDVTNNVYTTIYGEADLLKSLTARVQYTYSNTNRKSQKYYPKTTNVGKANGGLATIQNWKTDQQQLDALLTWHQNFAKKHDVKILGGTTWTKRIEINDGLQGRGFSTDEFSYNNMGAASTIDWISSKREDNTTVSFFGRAEYVLDGKYILNASIRADGASNFGKGNKWGYFPSGSVAWQLGDESFMEFTKPLFYDIKLRASYGETGNNNIGNYAHIATIDYESYVLADKGVGGFAPANIENALLTWEKQRAFNVGLDVSVFNSRVNLTADYFITRNHNLLLNVYVPQITGFNTSLQNIGEVENRGWELTLSTLNLKGAFEWTTDFNISSFKNKVLKLGPDGAPIIGTNHITEIGQPMGMFYGYITDGVFMNQAELDAGPIWAPGSSDRSHVGDVRFKDVSGPDGVPDGVINTYDKTIMGSPYPKAYFGMTNSFSYKNFGLSIALQGSFGNKVFNSSDAQLYTRARYKQYESVKNYWVSEEQPGDGESPRPNNLPTGGVREKSTRYLDNGSYLKVNNINFSYDFPTQLISKAGMSALKLYLTLTNPFIITKFRDFNPEVGDGNNPLTPGVMNYNYPLAKSAIIGINVSF